MKEKKNAPKPKGTVWATAPRGNQRFRHEVQVERRQRTDGVVLGVRFPCTQRPWRASLGTYGAPLAEGALLREGSTEWFLRIRR